MKLTLRNAGMSDIYQMGLNLSEISKAELSSMFGSNWWQALRLVKDFLAAGPAEVLLQDGQPICALGHMPHAHVSDARVTWFLATPAYYALGARGVIYGRNYMKKLQREYPETNFYSYSKSPHPDVGRWFRLCGYSRAGDGAYVLPLAPQSAKKTGSTRA